MLAFCEARRHTGRDDDEIDIFVRRSTDGGRTWGERKMVVSDGDRTCGNPCPVVDRRTGTVILTFCKDNQQVFVTRSDDDVPVLERAGGDYRQREGPVMVVSRHGAGAWHSASQRAAAHSLLVGRQPGAGDVEGSLPPVWNQVQSSFRVFQRRRRVDVGAWGGDDKGRLGRVRGGGTAWTGRVYMNMRSRHGIKRRAYAHSYDGGETWTDVEYDPNLPEPSCQASVVRSSGTEGACSCPIRPIPRYGLI